MNLATTRHILMTVALRTLARFWKRLFEKVTEGSLGPLMGRGLIQASGHSHYNQALKLAPWGKIVSVAGPWGPRQQMK